MLKISAEHLRALGAHLAAGYPHEACGILIGDIDDAGEERVVRGVVPVRNAWELEATPSDVHGLHDRYSIDPADVARADKAARRQGWDIVGFFHSHPDSPAIASETDREWAWPVVSFVIAAVYDGRVTDVRSWRLSDDRSVFLEERIATE
jgi:proteasome lid subunit RPN8/RPN11